MGRPGCLVGMHAGGLVASAAGWGLLAAAIVLGGQSCLLLSLGIDCSGIADLLAAHGIGPGAVSGMAPAGMAVIIAGVVVSIISPMFAGRGAPGVHGDGP